MTRPKFRLNFTADPAEQQMTLKDGRKLLFPQGLKIGGPVLLIGENSDTILPVGSYELSYGKKFTVAVAGIISGIVDDIKARKMTYTTELQSKKQKARLALALQLKKLHGKK